MEKPYHHNRQCEVWMSYTDLSIFSPKIKWKVAFPASVVVVVWYGGLFLRNGFCHLLVVCAYKSPCRQRVCAWIGNAQATTSHPQYALSALSLTVTLTSLILTLTSLILTLTSLILTLTALTLTVTLTARDEAPRSSVP